MVKRDPKTPSPSMTNLPEQERFLPREAWRRWRPERPELLVRSLPARGKNTNVVR